MKKTVVIGIALTALAGFGAMPHGLNAQAPKRVTTTLPAAELVELSRIRADVWVNWFSGDTAALRRVLAPELVAMSAGSARWQSIDETIAASAVFKRGGGTFVSVAFDNEVTHRFGETVVMFSTYVVVTVGGTKRSVQQGRATEVFVRSNGRWVHTSWHLDSHS